MARNPAKPRQACFLGCGLGGRGWREHGLPACSRVQSSQAGRGSWSDWLVLPHGAVSSQRGSLRRWTTWPPPAGPQDTEWDTLETLHGPPPSVVPTPSGSRDVPLKGRTIDPFLPGVEMSANSQLLMLSFLLVLALTPSHVRPTSMSDWGGSKPAAPLVAPDSSTFFYFDF